MLDKPFSGKELFCMYQFLMKGQDQEAAEQEWDEEIGKAKKTTWNRIAAAVNQRMMSEPNFIRGTNQYP